MILNELIPVLKRWIQTRALSPPMRPSPAIPHTAPVLGWLGVIPFAVCAALASTGGVVPPGAALHALVLYGVVILSFMGGAHWGLARAAADASPRLSALRLAFSVVPALAGFVLSFLPAVAALVGLSAAFIALLAYDIAAARAGAAPAWYPALRLQLTGAVVICLLIAAIFGRS